jgi:hypothetical protein
MPDLFDVIEAAIAAHGAGAREIGPILGMMFRAPGPGSNNLFEVATAQRSRVVDELVGAELRIRRESGAVGLMILDVDKRVRCVPSRDVVGRYGRATNVTVPHPPQPDDAPIYSVYPQGWGELRVGVSNGCVVSVVAEFRE